MAMRIGVVMHFMRRYTNSSLFLNVDLIIIIEKMRLTTCCGCKPLAYGVIRFGYFDVLLLLDFLINYLYFSVTDNSFGSIKYFYIVTIIVYASRLSFYIMMIKSTFKKRELFVYLLMKCITTPILIAMFSLIVAYCTHPGSTSSDYGLCFGLLGTILLFVEIADIYNCLLLYSLHKEFADLPLRERLYRLQQ